MKKTLLLGTLLSVPFVAHAEWFEDNTPLTQAHQHLLEGNLTSMFDSMVEVWQLDKSDDISNHLNGLLGQALTADCGRGLDSKQFPDWINAVTLRRVNIQSPGRDAYQVLIEASAGKPVSAIRLTQWVDQSISSDSSFKAIKPSEAIDYSPTTQNAGSNTHHYVKRYNLNNELSVGLYRLDITAKDQESWSTWVILGNQKAKRSVRWASKDHWKVEKNALLNKYCPLPKLGVTVYDYVDSDYKPIWKHFYDSDFPTSLPVDSLPPNNYVMAVSITEQRWQGPLILEKSQVISKSYSVANKEQKN
ncbi:DUF2861 family protein [Vibrio palustris]|uniref:DUF2861 domain-containing protein n=1 Tax=Vibrio palustris TaxID=1918946 RepID=A0A1R4B4M1_9VIBR|nr:DUF2861 family protein [Vibrio palustris]SJL83856.1 hypothetical protein VPAL9027_01835 [Vibrio palustris]